MQSSFYLLIAFYLIFTVLFLLRTINLKRREAAITLFFVILGIILFALESTNLLLFFTLLSGILLFNGILSSSKDKDRFLYIIAAIVFLLINLNVNVKFLAQAMMIGIVSSVAYKKTIRELNVNKRMELQRDIVHILAGLLIIAAFFIFKERLATILLLFGILIGIFVIVYADVYKRGRLSELLHNMERRGSNLGHGALWLALGALVSVSFLSNPFVIAVFGAILIGDPIATIVGLRYNRFRLPYNKEKSVSGSVAYFLVTVLIAYPFLGIYSVPIALVAALIEGVKIGIDDNIAVALFLVFFIYISSYLGLRIVT